MKKLVLITTAAVLLIVAGGCTTGRMASTGVYYDDIYYAPDLTKENMEQAFAPVPYIAKEEKKDIKKEERELVREYERSELKSEQKDTRDFSEIEEKYASILADEETEEVDSLIYYNDETGYWVGGFDGSEMDRDYAERLIRFHGPFTRIPYWSPLYDQFVYFNDPDWNVYVDGNYAYAFPTWSNPWYDRYWYDRWSTPWSFSFGYNSFWGDPYYYGYGWYDPFYSPYYSWGYYSWPYYYRPYYNYWHYPYYHYGYYSNDHRKDVYRGIRPSMSSNTRYSGTSQRSNTLKNGGNDDGRTVSTTRSGTRIIQNSDGSTTVVNTEGNTQRAIRGTATLKSGDDESNERSISRYRGSGASTGTVQTSTRRSSTPTYSQPDNASKPSYNRTSTYTRQVRSTSRSGSDDNLKSGSSYINRTTRSSVPSQTRSYNTGSSSQQRTSVRSRSYIPIQKSSSSSSFNRSSSSSRSSSSYSGTSSSGTRSTGSTGSSSGSGRTIRGGRR